MSETEAAVDAHPRRPWAAPLRARSPHEAHRVATPLELFFDLVIVVAVARAASGLHHSLAEGHFAAGVATFAMVFFGVWWAWVNFTWFASAYDNDDVAYRLLVLLQLTGALVFAAGIQRFEHGDPLVGVAGYVIMRLALVAQWLRAAKGDPERCRCAHRYAWGVLAVQTGWLGFLFAPTTALFWTLAACELLVPAWAEYKAPTPWHPHHIAERYGLFTLITLGESILAASVAVQSASDSGARFAVLMPTVAGGLLIVFSCWWLYFELPGHEVLTSPPRAFLWGYGHYFVFASAAAVGAGLAVVVDQSTGRSHISATAAGATVAIPAAAFLFCIWFLHTRTTHGGGVRWAAPLAIGGLLLTPFTGQPVLAAGLLLAGLTAAKVAAGGASAKERRR